MTNKMNREFQSVIVWSKDLKKFHSKANKSLFGDIAISVHETSSKRSEDLVEGVEKSFEEINKTSIDVWGEKNQLQATNKT